MSIAGGGLIFLWSASSTGTSTVATATAATATEPDGYIGAGGLGVWEAKPTWAVKTPQWNPKPGRWRRWRKAA